jgi:hypothetical protein
VRVWVSKFDKRIQKMQQRRKKLPSGAEAHHEYPVTSALVAQEDFRMLKRHSRFAMLI